MESDDDREKLLEAENDLGNNNSSSSNQKDNVVEGEDIKYERCSNRFELEEMPNSNNRRARRRNRYRFRIPRFLSSMDKRYLLALSIPAVFLLIYVLANFSTWLLENPSDLKLQLPHDYLSSETQLKVLYLLQKQQQGLLRLWSYVNSANFNQSSGGRTTPNEPESNSASASVPATRQSSVSPPPPRPPPPSKSLPAQPKTPSPPPASKTVNAAPAKDSNVTANKPKTPATPSKPASNATVEGSPPANRSLIAADPSSGMYAGVTGAFAAELLEQIKLNQELQEALLLPHQITVAANGSEANSTVNFYQGSKHICKTVSNNVERKALKWKPRRDKFLVAICLSGQMSNHLICLEKHMFFAALLNRVLVLPSPKLDYQFEHALDIQHMKDCLGAENILTFEEFASKRKGHLHIDKLICYIASPPCFMDDDHVRKYKQTGWSIGKTEVAWPEDAKIKGYPSHPHAEETVKRFSTNDDVIGVGDLFFADVEEQWVMQMGGPLKHPCKTIIKPNQYILLTAQRFIQTYLGGNFIALHFRRYGFLKFCNAKNESCYFPIPQAANCILRKVRLSNSPVIYLSTDAPESETNLLQALMVMDGKTVPLLKRPSHDGRAKWDALLYRHRLHSDDQVFAMLDKTICALSSVFIGTSGSTFTDDIVRLRRDWGTASSCDEFICQGEHPNFQADMD